MEPHNEDHGILGSMLGPPYCRKLPNAPGPRFFAKFGLLQVGGCSMLQAMPLPLPKASSTVGACRITKTMRKES